MKGYISGKRERNGEVTIHVDGRRLDPVASLALRNHSPTGFEWGYSGSGPAQTSLAILLDLGASKEDAQKHYQDFKSDFIATQPRHVLHIPMSHVRAWAQERGLAIRQRGRPDETHGRKKSMAKPDKQQDRTERYHKEFAAQLIEQIKKGTAPWQKPWKVGERIGPRNLASGRPYSGSNTLRLMAAAADRGYSDSRWATYAQIQAAGDRVRKGERGTRILSFKTHRRVAVKDEKGQPVKDKNGEQVYRHEKLARPFTRIYTVFNVEQARKLKPEPKPETGKAWEAHKRADAVIRASGVPVKHVQGDRAYYSLGSDQVVLPEKSQFPSADHYYQTALHELGHASGHPDRLNRDTLQQGLNDGFASESYAREELRAEISAMMTGDRLGTGHDPSRGAAYVSGWVEVLDKSPQEIVNASAEAQRMSNYLISRAEERQQNHGEKTQDQAVPGQQREPRYRVVLDKTQTAWRVENASDPGEKLPSYARRDFRNVFDAKQALKRLQQDQARPTYIEEARQRAAARQQSKETGRQYRAVPVPHRPGAYRIQDAQDPSRPVPSPYGTMYAGKADAERAIEQLRQDQKRGTLPAESVRARPGVIVEEKTSLPGGRPAARVASPNGGLVRGAGRPGVRQDQFPSRTAPER